MGKERKQTRKKSKPLGFLDGLAGAAAESRVAKQGHGGQPLRGWGFGCRLSTALLPGLSHVGARGHGRAPRELGSVPGRCDLYSVPSPNPLQKGLQGPQPAPCTAGREKLVQNRCGSSGKPGPGAGAGPALPG